MNEAYKYFTLMATLREAEVAAFKKYLARAHDGAQVTLKVFNYFQRFHPNFDQAPSLQSAHRKIFKVAQWDKEVEGKKMLNAFHDLHKWLKEFLIAEKIGDKNSLLTQNLWLQILKERGISGEFSKKSAQAYEKAKQQASVGDLDTCLENIKTVFFYTLQHQESARTGEISDLHQSVNMVLQYCEVIALKMQCENLNLKKIWPNNPDNTPAPSEAEPSPLLLLYRAIRDLLESEDESHFYQAVALLEAHHEKLGSIELADIIQHLDNYIAQKIRKGGGKTWMDESHRLNIMAVACQVFEKNKFISNTNFNNSVNIACALTQYDWAETFVKEQGPYLPLHARQESALLAQAVIAFEKKKYELVLSLLIRSTFKDYFHEIRARLLSLRSLFILERDLETIESACLNFEAYLKRQKKGDNTAFEATSAFLRVFKMLAAQKVERQKIMDEIDTKADMYLKDWLIEKAKVYTPLTQ